MPQSKSKTVVQRPHTPWINPEILQAKRERSRLERCWRRWKSPFDRMKFRAQCNSVRSLISKAKSSFLSNLVTESSDNPRTLWKTLNTILHRNPSNSLPESQMHHPWPTHSSISSKTKLNASAPNFYHLILLIRFFFHVPRLPS